MDTAEMLFAARLRLFLPPRQRSGQVRAPCDGTSTIGHVIESFGPPLPEVGRIVVNGETVVPAYRPVAGDVVEVFAVRRPQRLPAMRFLLDVHLGALARRMRLVGLDTAYPGDQEDESLIDQANADQRVLLTQDRALLRRRKLWLGSYVRGARPDEQLRDVVDRFVPPLNPWTRCTVCNGLLSSVGKHEVEPALPPGTRRTYEIFSRCPRCARVYWRGAHSTRLTAIVDSAIRTAATARKRVGTV